VTTLPDFTLPSQSKALPQGRIGDAIWVIRQTMSFQSKLVHSAVPSADGGTSCLLQKTCEKLCKHFKSVYSSITYPELTKLPRGFINVPLEVLTLAVAIYAGREDLVRAIATQKLAKHRNLIAVVSCTLDIALAADQISLQMLLLSLIRPDTTKNPGVWLGSRLDLATQAAHERRYYSLLRALIQFRL
jgi:hypothetical protein